MAVPGLESMLGAVRLRPCWWLSSQAPSHPDPGSVCLNGARLIGQKP